MKIVLKNCINKNASVEQIKHLITMANVAVMNAVKLTIELGVLPLEQLYCILDHYMTSLYVTYDEEEMNTVLNNLDIDSDNLLSSCKNEENFVLNACYEIGTNSEIGDMNFSLTERVIIILALAKFFKIEFDFS